MFWLRNWVYRQPRAAIEALLRRVEALIPDGTVASEIESIFALDEVAAVLRRAGSASPHGVVEGARLVHSRGGAPGLPS